MPNELEQRAGRAIAERTFPGCVIGLVHANGEHVVLPFGRFTYASDSSAVEHDTIYDMASVTKSVPVASLALTFIAEGKMRLSEKVRTYLPELQNHYDATVEDLLRYRVRGARMSTLGLKTFEEIRTRIFETGFSGPPGAFVYTNVPAFFLGIIIERVGGAILPALADRYFFGPLEMRDTTFFPHDISRIPPTEIIAGEEIHGIVHDESARVFSRARRAVGHAGVFSTAPDILKFLAALLRGQMPHVLSGAQDGLGWQRAEPWFMGTHVADQAFGKTGFTGTSVAVDPHKGIGLVVLSNRTYPERPVDAAELTSAINRFRGDVADIVFGGK